jgi:hypothetical protein
LEQVRSLALCFFPGGGALPLIDADMDIANDLVERAFWTGPPHLCQNTRCPCWHSICQVIFAPFHCRAC